MEAIFSCNSDEQVSESECESNKCTLFQSVAFYVNKVRIKFIKVAMKFHFSFPIAHQQLLILYSSLQCICKLNRHRHVSVRVCPPIPQTCLKTCKSFLYIFRNLRNTISTFCIPGRRVERNKTTTETYRNGN